MRTYLGFDTIEDARTFRDFLIKEGYENTDIEKSHLSTNIYAVIYKVWFDKK